MKIISNYRYYLVFNGIFFAAIAYIFFDSAYTLNNRWDTNHEAYSHGHALMIICAFLFARLCLTYNWQSIKPFYPAIILTTAVAAMWLVAQIASVRVVEQMMLPVILWSFIWLLWGNQAAVKLSFPIALIYTVIPIWDILNPTLQAMTVWVNSTLLSYFNIPLYVDNLYISIPAGTFEVAQGCSGLSYLLMITTFSLIYSHLYINNSLNKFILVVFGALFGIVCNWIRVLILILVGHSTEMQSSLMTDHEYLGLLLFAVFLIPVGWLGKVLSQQDTTQHTTQAHEICGNENLTTQQILPNLNWYIVACASLLIVYALTMLTPNKTSATTELADIQAYEKSLKQQLTKLKFQQTKAPNINVPFNGFDSGMFFKHPILNQQLSFFTYPMQTQGKELIHENNQLISPRYTIVKQIAPPENNSTENISRIIIADKKTNRQYLFSYWYQVGNKTTVSESKAKLYQILEYIQGRKYAALITTSIACTGDCTATIKASELNDAQEITHVFNKAAENFQ